MIILLIVVLIIMLFIFILYFIIKNKLRSFLNDYFDANTLKEAFEKSEKEASETPKSISSMEPLYKGYIKDDFPDTNIDELKSMAENCILDVLNSVETKDVLTLNNYSGKIKSYAEKMVEDSKGKDVVIDNIKIHRTAISKYKHDDVTATITLTTTLEYFYKIGDKTGKKIQDRFKTELIYVIDAKKYGELKDSIGINCPNCGAPITNLGHKKCVYCGTGIRLITKNAWIVNNIKQE